MKDINKEQQQNEQLKIRLNNRTVVLVPHIVNPLFRSEFLQYRSASGLAEFHNHTFGVEKITARKAFQMR